MNAKEIFCLKIIGDSNFEILQFFQIRKMNMKRLKYLRKRDIEKFIV